MRGLLTPYQVGREATIGSDSVSPELLSGSFVRRLFLLFLVATVIPVYELPGVGLSVTAPLMFFIALEMFAGRRSPARRSVGNQWTGPLFLVAYGMLISVCANLLLRQVDMGADVVVTLVRYSYWWLTFLVIVNMSSHEAWMRHIIIVLGISAIGLAGVRALDAFLVGGWGLHDPAFRPQFLAKNMYGIQFSSFGPFAFVLPLVVDRKHRSFALVGALFLLLVVLANGSRGSWVALAAGGSVSVAIYSVTHSARGQWVWALPLVIFMIVFRVPLPGQIENVVNYQRDTFEDLDADKSYAFRQVMVQKARILFEEYPVFGVGLNQFKQTYVPELIIPPILQRHAGSFVAGSPHNSYIHYLAELGLVGTIPFALFLARLAFQGTQTAIRFARKEEVWALGVLWSFVSMSVHLWSFAGLGSTGPWLAYGLVAGMIVQSQIPKRLGAAGDAFPNIPPN